MTLAVTKAVKLEVWETWCGHWVALPPARVVTLRQTGETFWCPYGHGAVFAEPEVERLRERLADAQEKANVSAQQAAAAEGSLSRLNKRVHVGVCPHCHRTFKQLARHMQNKHEKALSK